jgi:hypothetical protein
MLEQFSVKEKEVITYCVNAIKEFFPDLDWSAEKRDLYNYILIHTPGVFESAEFQNVYGYLYKEYLLKNRIFNYIIAKESRKEV